MLPSRKLLFVRSVSLCKVTSAIMPKPKNDKGNDDGDKNDGSDGKNEESKPKSRRKRSVFDAPAYTDANGNPVEEFR